MKGDTPLLPIEVQKIRAHLTSSNSLNDLILYTMLIVSIKGGIRAGFLVKFKFDMVLKDLSTVREDGLVSSLSVQFTVCYLHPFNLSLGQNKNSRDHQTLER